MLAFMRPSVPNRSVLFRRAWPRGFVRSATLTLALSGALAATLGLSACTEFGAPRDDSDAPYRGPYYGPYSPSLGEPAYGYPTPLYDPWFYYGYPGYYGSYLPYPYYPYYPSYNPPPAHAPPPQKPKPGAPTPTRRPPHPPSGPVPRSQPTPPPAARPPGSKPPFRTQPVPRATPHPPPPVNRRAEVVR